MSVNFLFPFNSFSDEELLNAVDLRDMLRQDVSDSFDPFSVQDSSYNNDLDVNQFYIRSRNISFHYSEYVYLENISSLSANSDFNVFLLNIRSMSTNFQFFKDTVLTDNITYDVLGFTETRLDSGISALYTLPTYTMFSNDRNTYGGGVAVYVSNRYTSCKINEYNRMEAYVESLGVEVKCNSEMFLFICVYRPPQGDVNSFINALTEILTLTKDKNYNEIFIFGDFNLNLLHTTQTSCQMG